MSMHFTQQLCPRCGVHHIHHVHCTNVRCTFHIHICPKCDPEQAVNAFMREHARDCTHATPANGVHTQARYAARV